MKYEERTRKIGTWLVKLLKRYSPPATMDDETLREEMNLIVEDINKHIPSQFEEVDLDQTLGKIDGHVRALQSGRTWPTIKIFITATKEAVSEYSRAITAPKVTSTMTPDRSNNILIGRILDGGEIPDYLLNPDSPHRQQLIATGLVSDKDFEKYLAPINR